MTKRTYYREPETAGDLYARITALEAEGVINEQLAEALYIAVGHQSQLDFDGLQEEYNETDSEELRALMQETGVVILLTEEQTKLVKYGV